MHTKGSACEEKKWKPHHIGSWEEFVGWVEATRANEFLFRGQPQRYGTLESTFLRILRAAGGHCELERPRIDAIEEDLLARFVRTAPLHLQEMPMQRLALLSDPKRDILLWWGIMQHYGAATRVLDWTVSPYVAAYFAVEKDFTEPGEVLGYDKRKLEEFWQPAIDAGKMRQRADSKRGGFPRGLEDFQRNGLRINGVPVLQHFIHNMQTARMAAQQGVFTVCTDVYQDHAELLRRLLGRQAEDGAYRRAIIPAQYKIEFLDRLSYMNITGVSLFPTIDGVGRSTAAAARINLALSRGSPKTL